MQDFQLLVSEPGNGMLELTLIGELDLGTVGTLTDATSAAVASGDYDCLIFDLSQLDFIDSSGLHALTNAHRDMAALGNTTKIVCSGANLLKVFELTGIDNLLHIVGERSEALAIAA